MGWFATAWLVYGCWLLGERRKAGFLFNIVGKACWAYVGLTRGSQWDLVAVSLVFVLLYGRNYWLWSRAEI